MRRLISLCLLVMLSVCTIIGMVVGMVVGLICLAVGAGPTGPIGGIFIGAVGGATVGLWLGNRRPKTIKS